MRTLRYLFCLTLAFVSCSRSFEAAEKVDESPLPVKAVRAFPELRFDRPVYVTHAGDGSNRVFVVEQKGTIQVLPNDQDAEETKEFFDINSRVVYKDKENEEGLLGMAFHPNYKENGEFFLYYTTTSAPHTSVISRFRVSDDDPDKADAEYEEELLRIKQPFWNHNGGTIVFGPDGYLYIGLGDGGLANDPFGNGQNLGRLHGSILRIDVDNKDEGKNYAIPADNPFVGRPGARPETWAYGLRNVWRMAFDGETGLLWAGDVGQDKWEEIDIIVGGGNYGWNVREGLHSFRGKGEQTKDMIDPIWEYHHDVGKSITGGQVYRGKLVPELVGKYLYGDYVSGKYWALDYDEDEKKVVANHPLTADNLPVMSFGEDEQGEVYFTTTFGTLHRFESTAGGTAGGN